MFCLCLHNYPVLVLFYAANEVKTFVAQGAQRTQRVNVGRYIAKCFLSRFNFQILNFMGLIKIVSTLFDVLVLNSNSSSSLLTMLSFVNKHSERTNTDAAITNSIHSV